MATSLMKKLFGDTSSREIKRILPLVEKIEALEPEYAALTDAQLQAKTPWFRERLAGGETLDELLPEAFAAMREADRRVLGEFPFRVQLIGGIILHQGRIAEMKTGEGKTLTSTLPAYLNGLTGKGVHIVTVNDYLAKYQGEMMGNVYRFMGLSCGIIIHDLDKEQRRAAYAADVTYGTNNEMGFDYLRDNMCIFKQDMVQRPFHFAVVDEVDSILIDEARTPLIISGQGDKSTDLYRQAELFARTLTPLKLVEVDEKESQEDIPADYIVDEKANTATITPRGVAKAEKYFGCGNLSDPENATLLHHINQAIKAHGCMKRDTDYVVQDGQIIIVDEFTGRLMLGRRYSEGLHQAIEAKEGVNVASENKTLATITFQNLFRLYKKLSGMTGTALTEEEEFSAIYNLDIVEIPTNKPVIRIDHHDVVYKTEAGKFRAVIEQIKRCHEKGQPVLVGTISIEKSELLSKLLKREGVPHTVLNAKHHEREAEIVAQAGKFGAVTISTNMAGRGTDIMLGGNAEYLALSELRKKELPEELIAEANSYAETTDPEILAVREEFKQALAKHKAAIAQEAEKVRAAGGLFIVGTERHESRRIDNQLRGRSGRQGDPGETRFFLSLEDDVMRLFGSERVMSMMNSLGIDEDTPIDAKMLSSAIENAQKTVESRNFQIRKNVLEYDNVMNTQRSVIYEQRQKVLDGEDLSSTINGMMKYVIDSEVEDVYGAPEHADSAEQLVPLTAKFEGIYFAKGAFRPDASMSKQQAKDKLETLFHETYARREQEFGAERMREIERIILLRVVDEYWMDQIDAMDDLKQGIRLRAYGQTDPVVAYKREGYAMFDGMINAIREETVRRLFLFRLRTQEDVKRKQVATIVATGGADKTVKKQPVKKIKIGANDPCPCGSGKKYKYCCRDKDEAKK